MPGVALPAQWDAMTKHCVAHSLSGSAQTGGYCVKRHPGVNVFRP